MASGQVQSQQRRAEDAQVDRKRPQAVSAQEPEKKPRRKKSDDGGRQKPGGDDRGGNRRSLPA